MNKQKINLTSTLPADKIAIIPQELRAEFLLNILTRTYTLAGKVISSEDLTLMVLELSNEIPKRHPGFTIDEIDQACKNGVYGDYGDYITISVKTINFWLKEYSIMKKLREQKNIESIPMIKRANFILRGVLEFKKNKINP